MPGRDVQGRAVPGSARLSRARPERTGRGHEGLFSDGQDWVELDRTCRGGKGSVRQRRGRQDKAGPDWVGCGRVG